MNKVLLMGRLTRDPEVRQAGETTVARYALAVDRRGKKDEADFINCVVFGKGAEFAEKYLKKGTKIAVTGHIQTGSYKSNEGRTVYTTDVVVEDQEFCESKKAAEERPEAPAAETFVSLSPAELTGLPFN